MNVLKIVNNFIFPPRCIFCDTVLDFREELHVCEECMDAAELPAGKRCRICFSKTYGSFGTELCAYCRAQKPYYDKLTARYLYDKRVRSCILRLKFHGRTDYSHTVGKLMSELIGSGSDADMLIPVPISKRRFRERGYNQSVLFTKEISRICNIPMRTDLLFKVKDTEPQSSLRFSTRADNVKGAYRTAENNSIGGKRIILTDDVATTRSTLNECAKILKRAGARSVECITFAAVDRD